MATEHGEVCRKILLNNLEKLQKANPAFSMRMLAQKLEISHSFLSRILSGKAKLPASLIDGLVVNLKIDQFEAATLKTQPESSSSASSIKGADTSSYASAPEAHVRIMRKWWNLAILDLLTCETNIRYTEETIPLFIPISKEDAKASIAELSEIGLIERTADGLRKTDEKLRLPTRGPNEHTRAFYQQTLRLASDQLNKTSVKDYENRLILGLTCAVNPQNIPLVKQKLAATLRECAELLSEGDCTDVFLVQGQMFSLLKS